ncbi:MAG TPA: integrase [Dielma fastidiosa]|nr:integrase [Dielma fastidiosa]
MKNKDFENGIPEFITDQKCSEKSANTLKKYEHGVRRFVDALPADCEITKEHTLAYKDTLLNSSYKPATISSYIIVMNKYLKWIGVPELRVKQLKVQRKSSLTDVLTPEEYNRLLRKAKANGHLDTYYIMKVLANTGIRVGELKYFTVENLKSNYLQINNKGKIRTVPIRQDLARELRKYCRDKNIRTGTIFAGKTKGKQMAVSTIWRRLQRLAGELKIKKTKIHPHSFRHLFAKQFLKENSNGLAELADLLGHESLETTRIYLVSTDEEKKKKLEGLKY